MVFDQYDVGMLKATVLINKSTWVTDEVWFILKWANNLKVYQYLIAIYSNSRGFFYVSLKTLDTICCHFTYHESPHKQCS